MVREKGCKGYKGRERSRRRTTSASWTIGKYRAEDDFWACGLYDGEVNTSMAVLYTYLPLPHASITFDNN